MIKRAITYILANDATVASLVGNNTADDKVKVYPVVVPESEKAPYVVVTVLGRTVASKGCSDQWNIQVVCYHTISDDCVALHEACRDALLGTAAATINGYEFSFVNFSTESDGFIREGNLYYKIAVYDGQ